MINRGYVVGDVIDIDGVNLYARSSRCFPALKLSPPAETTLEDAVELSSGGLSFALKLKQIFSSSAGADLNRKFKVKFSDVKIISSTRLDLKDAFDRAACPELAPLIDVSITAVDHKAKQFFIISELMYGKREASLELKGNENLAAAADNLAKVVGDASVKIEASGGGIVSVKSDALLPIAMKPMTVPKVIAVSDFKNIRGEADIAWLPLECSKPKDCYAEFIPFAHLVGAFHPAFMSSELNE
jgi:hypothetical protein